MILLLSSVSSSTTPLILLSSLLLLALGVRSCQGFSYNNLATLTPQTSAVDVVRANLLAFQNRDLQSAFNLASPRAQADINHDVDVYRLIMTQEQGWICYGHLIEHRNAEILMERSSSHTGNNSDDKDDDDCHKVLVRVVPSIGQDTTAEEHSNVIVKEYWWTLSRSFDTGCYMVDAIDPAGTLPLDWSNYFF